MQKEIITYELVLRHGTFFPKQTLNEILLLWYLNEVNGFFFMCQLLKMFLLLWCFSGAVAQFISMELMLIMTKLSVIKEAFAFMMLLWCCCTVN